MSRTRGIETKRRTQGVELLTMVGVGTTGLVFVPVVKNSEDKTWEKIYRKFRTEMGTERRVEVRSEE